MKAIRIKSFGGPEVLQVADVAEPVAGAGQVLIRVYAAGVNPVETYMRSGNYALLPALPFTPGGDTAGIVEAVGNGVTEFAIGDRVYTSGTVTGGYAELALAQLAQTHALPDEVSFAQGAALGVPYATAYRALFQRARAQAGEIVLVHGGTGAVGVGAVQLAVASGMKVIATGGTAAGRDELLQQGAAAVFDHHAPDHLQQIMAFTGGRGVDVVLEMLANVNLGHDLGILAAHGRVVVIGNRGTVEINPRDLMLHDGAILGMLLFNASEPDLRSIHAGLHAGLKTGFLRPVIAVELPLHDAPRAHELVLQSGHIGKVILLPQGAK
jgi:NADPH2:quinone reductase